MNAAAGPPDNGESHTRALNTALRNPAATGRDPATSESSTSEFAGAGTSTSAALSPGSTLVGRVEWIGLRPGRRETVQQVATATVVANQGLAGDHGHKSVRSQRHVTLIQAEHLPEIAQRQGLPEVRPEQLRRNIVVSGLSLLSLKGKSFRIGTAVLFATGDCSPCARMAEALGEGAQRSMSNRGGIIARVVSGGEVSIGDEVAQADMPDAARDHGHSAS